MAQKEKNIDGHIRAPGCSDIDPCSWRERAAFDKKSVIMPQHVSFFQLLWRFTMSDLPNCPKCNSAYTYQDGTLYICPECAHEWSASEISATEEARVWKDANGNVLQNGDTVTVIKDLKVRGSSSVIKGGTKVKNIRLVDGDHDIDCKIEGIGPMQLKSEFVRKA
jgi:protein PhnA